MLEDEESEEELGAGVTAAFNSFKTQLKTHFSVSTKQKQKSLQTDCQFSIFFSFTFTVVLQLSVLAYL